MVGTVGGDLDLQGPAIERLGLVVASEKIKRRGQIVGRQGHVGMSRTEKPTLPFPKAAQQRLRLGAPARGLDDTP